MQQPRFAQGSVLLFVLALMLPMIASSPAEAGDRLFTESVTLLPGNQARFPLYEGVRAGESVYYIVVEASDDDAGDDYGVADINKLENVAGTGAVMHVTFDSAGRIVFPASVDFSPERIVEPTPGTGFPPAVAQPGAIAEMGYSPLIQLPNGTVLNAPQVMNASGFHDSGVSINTNNMTVVMQLTEGFARKKPVLYLSTEASAMGPAALEASTYAPKLNEAPGLGDDSSSSARSTLVAFVNGDTGANPPQGINAALLGLGDPQNLLGWLPNQGRYSPLWDVHLTAFAPGEDAELVERVADVEDLAEDDEVTAPDGSPWGPSNFIVNCPVIQRVD